MTTPKMKPCPNCNTDAYLCIYSYEQTGGTRHVECDKCYYLGPGAGSNDAAVKAHNSDLEDRRKSA